jgi:hypothetical protein
MVMIEMMIILEIITVIMIMIVIEMEIDISIIEGWVVMLEQQYTRTSRNTGSHVYITLFYIQ